MNCPECHAGLTLLDATIGETTFSSDKWTNRRAKLLLVCECGTWDMRGAHVANVQELKLVS